jgi:hypothetical protein
MWIYIIDTGVITLDVLLWITFPYASFSADRRQLPPEDFNCPDLTYALQPSGVDDQGTKIYSLFRYLMAGMIVCV